MPFRHVNLRDGLLVLILAWFGLGGAPLTAAVDSARIEAARVLFQDEKKSAEAHAAFAAIARDEPENATAQLHLGLLAYRRDDTEKAVEQLERAVKLAPRDGEAYKALGDAYGRTAQKASLFTALGWAKKCQRAYEQAVVLAPDRVDFRQCLFEYYRQAPGFAGGSHELALAEATAIKKLDPDRGRLAFALLYVREKKWDQAFAQYDEVLATEPDNYLAHYRVGELAANTGRSLDRGLTALRRCLALTPPAGRDVPGHALVHVRIGSILEQKSDVAGARAAYDAALALDSSLAAAAEARRKLK